MERGRRIPNRLVKYRKLAGYSQKRVARLLHLKNTASISRWEKGYTTPSVLQLLNLCVLYKIYPHHIYFEVWDTLKKELLPTSDLSLE
ncbi:MAG: XRE family transcriptional regulator [Flavobacterium sp.]|nr:MAG: XRE family transcriptional regulator [Flavobacterium sp.]